MQPVLSPWTDTFERFLYSVENRAIIAAPYVTGPPLSRIKKAFEKDRQPEVSLLTNLSIESLLQGSVDGRAIAQLCRDIPTMTVRHLPGLHAKAYVADDHTAIITSGNLTQSSLDHNYEYGIEVSDPVLVRRIAGDLQEYSYLGTTVSIDALSRISEIAARLREKYTHQLDSTRAEAKREYEYQLSNTRDALMQLRGKSGETTNAIFARTILFLLKSKPLATREMHPLIQGIHPDICNDDVDRVINGVQFGKEWKHRVRGAQVDLRRKSLIELVEGRWRIVQES